MSTKPVFVATHPRACSTAFERVFMTRRNSLQTIHEPFGDAFYYGPERMGTRFEEDEQARVESGFSESTFKTIVDRIEQEAAEGKRIFIKDITHYLMPPSGQPSRIAPSLKRVKRGVGTGDDSRPLTPESGFSSLGEPKEAVPGSSDTDSGVVVMAAADAASGSGDENSSDAVAACTTTTAAEAGAAAAAEHPISPPRSPPFPYENSEAELNNPTVVPREILEKFHFTFLIRHPRSAIPSYYRCCIPPLVDRTHFTPFLPSEAGYDELRRLFDYLKSSGQIGPKVCGQKGTSKNAAAAAAASKPGEVEICVIDADDMLDDPEGVLKQYCQSIGLEFYDEMLNWDSEESHVFAKEQFEKWNGFHDDAINSTDLKPRQHKHKPKSDEELYADWVDKYGQEAADMIKQTVADNVADYEYLKQFAIKV